MTAIDYSNDNIYQALQKLQARLDAKGAPANPINFGSGANTPSGDLVAAALTRLQGRIDQLPAPVTLLTLALAANTIAENAAQNAVVGGVLNKTSGSTLTLIGTAGNRFALSGTNIVRGATALDYESATSHAITIRETHPYAIITPKDTTLTINVTNINEQPNLGALTFSATSFLVGTPSNGSINGATAGSTIGATGLPSGLTINSAARTWTWSGSGSAFSGNVVLTETLPDSANSGRQSTIAITVTAHSFSVNPSISSDGTPQVGEAIGFNFGVADAPFGAKRLLRNGVDYADASAGSFTLTETGDYRLDVYLDDGVTHALSPVVTVTNPTVGTMSAPFLSNPTGYTAGDNPPQTQVSDTDGSVSKDIAVLDMWYDRNSSGAFSYDNTRKVTFTDLMALFDSDEAVITGRTGLTAGPFREIARWRVPARRNSVFDGDSRTAMAADNGNQTDYVTVATGGSDYPQAIDRLGDSIAFRPRLLVLNPLQTLSANAAEAIAGVDAWVAQAQALHPGIPIMLGNSLPSSATNHSTGRPFFDAHIQQLLTNGTIQGVINYAGDSVIGPNAAISDSSLYSDYIHMTETGQTRMALVRDNAVSTFLATLPAPVDEVSAYSNIRSMTLNAEALADATTGWDVPKSNQYIRGEISSDHLEVTGNSATGDYLWCVTDNARSDHRYLELEVIQAGTAGDGVFPYRTFGIGIVPDDGSFMPDGGSLPDFIGTELAPPGTQPGYEDGALGNIIGVEILPKIGGTDGLLTITVNGVVKYTQAVTFTSYRVVWGPKATEGVRLNTGPRNGNANPFSYAPSGVLRYN